MPKVTSKEELELQQQPCKVCRDKKSTRKCTGHASGNDGASDEISGDMLKSAITAQNAINLKAMPIGRAYEEPVKFTAKPTEAAPQVNNENNATRRQPELRPESALSIKYIEIQRDTESSILMLIFDMMNRLLSAEQRNLINQHINTVWDNFIKLHPKQGNRLLLEKDANGNIISLKAVVPNEHFSKFISMLTNTGVITQTDANRIQLAMQNTYQTPRGPKDSFNLIRK